MTWAPIDGASLAMRFWGEECVAYAGHLGSTHLLDRTTGDLLRQLLAAPRALTTGEMAEAMGIDEDMRREADEALVERLHGLRRIGLISAAPKS